MNYKDRLEINSVAMFYYILKKWRSIVICALIASVLAGIGSYFLPKESVDVVIAKMKDEADYAAMSLDELYLELSDSDKENVMTTLQTYYDYKSELETKQDYYNKSVKMHIDPLRCPRYVVTYAVTDYAGFGETVPSGTLSVVDSILQLYKDVLAQPDVLEEIRSATGWTLDDGYLTELYDLTKSGVSILNLTVNANTQENCTAIAQVLQGRINGAIETVKQSYAHNMRKTNEYYYESVNKSLASAQKDQTDSIASTEKSILAIKNPMTKGQQAYYTALLNLAPKYMDETGVIDTQAMIAGEITVDEKADSDTDSDDEESLQNSRAIDPQYFVFGLLVGVILAFIYYFLTYNFSSKLRDKSDISGAFGLAVLGEIRESDSYDKAFGFVDKWIDRLFWRKEETLLPDDQLKMIASKVAIGAGKNGFHTLYITGVNKDSGASDWKNKIIDGVSATEAGKENLNLGSGESPLYDIDSQNKMAESDAIVLVEKVGTSRYEDIDRIVEQCSRFGVGILGAVVIC